MSRDNLYLVWPFMFKGLGGWVAPDLAMDNFCEVRGQSLKRRGTPFDRAQRLAECARDSSFANPWLCFVFAFGFGWTTGFVSAVIFLLRD